MRTLITAAVLFLSFLLLTACASMADMENRLNPKSIFGKSVNFITPVAGDYAADQVAVQGVLSGIGGDEYSKVELFIGGSLKKTFTSGSTFNYNWDATGAADGPTDIQFKVTLKSTATVANTITVKAYKGIFVSLTGSDLNPGTKALPMQSIQAAVNTAFTNGLWGVYVAQGTYSPGAGLNAAGSGVLVTNNTLFLIGGYNSSFQNRNGLTDLKGNNALLHVITCSNALNSSIDGFVIREGFANGGALNGFGGGILLFDVTNIVLSNLVVSNNYAAAFGGGVCAYSSSIFITKCMLNYNYSVSYGGGLFLYLNTSGQVLDCVIDFNYSGDGGGVFIHSTLDVNLASCDISCNTGLNAAGIYTFANNHSIGIYNCTLTNESSSFIDAVIILQGSPSLTNLVLSGCTIGGTFLAPSYGIYEYFADTTQQTFVNNIFLTNCLGNVYYDYFNGYITTGDDWTNINVAAFTGADTAYGNTVAAQ